MKNVKKIFALVIAIACAFTSIISAKAIDQTATFTASKRFVQQNLFWDAGTTLKKAKLASGSSVYALCFNHEKSAPGEDTILYLVDNSKGTFKNPGISNATVLTDGQISSLKNRLPAYVYILDNGIQPNGTWNDSLFSSISSSFTEYEKYYATQLALWAVLYKDDTKNGLNIDVLNKDALQQSLNDSLKKVKRAAQLLRDKALANKFVEPTMSINTSKAMYVTADRKYFRTDDYVVSGNGFTSYVATLSNAPAGAEIVNVSTGSTSTTKMTINAGQKVYVRVPYSNIKNVTSGTLTVSATAVKRNVAVYAPKDQQFQNMIIDYAETKSLSASTKYTATEEKGGVNVTKVYENAAGVKAKLNGVKLQLLDKNKKVVKEWVTDNTNNPMKIDGLTVGETYIIHEVSAPDTAKFKYVKSADIPVKIEANKVIDKEVVNKGTTDVEISKQDATTGVELPGAKLVLKDATGNEIESWVSGDKPHKVVNKNREDGKLVPGKYCLKETIAPEGYQISTEEVCFMVNNDGGVDEQVVMKNAPKTSVKISKQDITTKKELPGATLTVKDSNGKVVDTWVSGTTPHYLSLPDGTYTLIEVKPPKGYELGEEVKTFTIKAGEAEKTIVMTNSEIPKTADMNITLIVGALIATVLLVGFSLFKLNKQQES